VQASSLQRRSQPTKKLEEVIEEIRRLMLGSVQETANKGKLSRGENSITIGKEKKKQQQRR
jgi:hypothetical protein